MPLLLFYTIYGSETNFSGSVNSVLNIHRWLTDGLFGGTQSNASGVVLIPPSPCLSFRLLSHGVHAGEVLLLPHQVSDSNRRCLWFDSFLLKRALSQHRDDREEWGSQQLWALNLFLHLVARWGVAAAVIMLSYDKISGQAWCILETIQEVHAGWLFFLDIQAKCEFHFEI